MAQCMITLVYIGYTRPFEDEAINNTEIFNEICILGVSYSMYLFTDFVPNASAQYTIGFILIGITCFNTLVNSVLIMIDNIKAVVIYIKLFRLRLK
jgi:hypothetical protein